mmetsp:Transcript_18573/g.25760  ORF Transcript_18573/g.25760 Transcript_18573/m.25760 type:complete len:224 (-) Transcript_18573:118-789(-)
MRFSLSSSAIALVLSTCIVSIQANLPEEWPAFRYTEWNQLSSESKGHAKVLSYSEDVWNYPDNTDNIEYYDWNSLDSAEKASALILGWTEDTWDCYQNHYAYYDWAELVEYELDTPYKHLGYDEEMWNNDETSVAFGKYYDELTLEEKLAAQELCYFQANWDLEALSDYPVVPPVVSAFGASIGVTANVPLADDTPAPESSALGVTVTTTMFIVSAAFAVIVL